MKVNVPKFEHWPFLKDGHDLAMVVLSPPELPTRVVWLLVLEKYSVSQNEGTRSHFEIFHSESAIPTRSAVMEVSDRKVKALVYLWSY